MQPMGMYMILDIGDQMDDHDKEIFDLGIARGVEIYKKAILEMLTAQLDIEGDPDSECAACKITKNYIDIISGEKKDNGV